MVSRRRRRGTRTRTSIAVKKVSQPSVSVTVTTAVTAAATEDQRSNPKKTHTLSLPLSEGCLSHFPRLSFTSVSVTATDGATTPQPLHRIGRAPKMLEMAPFLALWRQKPQRAKWAGQQSRNKRKTCQWVRVSKGDVPRLHCFASMIIKIKGRHSPDSQESILHVFITGTTGRSSRRNQISAMLCASVHDSSPAKRRCRCSRLETSFFFFANHPDAESTRKPFHRYCHRFV